MLNENNLSSDENNSLLNENNPLLNGDGSSPSDKKPFIEIRLDKKMSKRGQILCGIITSIIIYSLFDLKFNKTLLDVITSQIEILTVALILYINQVLVEKYKDVVRPNKLSLYSIIVMFIVGCLTDLLTYKFPILYEMMGMLISPFLFMISNKLNDKWYIFTLLLAATVVSFKLR